MNGLRVSLWEPIYHNRGKNFVCNPYLTRSLNGSQCVFHLIDPELDL